MVYMLAVVAFLVSLSPKAPALPWTFINATSFVVCCAVISMTVIAAFVRFARPSRIFDSLADNAYGIYLVHYVVVSWVQYALLPMAVAGTRQSRRSRSVDRWRSAGRSLAGRSVAMRRIADAGATSRARVGSREFRAE